MPNNRIRIHFKNGLIDFIEWKDRSRSESWTPEMRERVRQKTIEFNKKRGGGQ